MPGARLSLAERSQIEVLFAQGLRFPAIAAAIGRDRSTVWREVSRNNAYRGAHLRWAGSHHPQGRSHERPVGLGGSYRWVYSAGSAHRRALRRSARRRRRKLRPGYGQPSPPLWAVVRDKLLRRWSPVQIATWLRREFPDRPEMWVSHETIYQAIYVQGRGQLRRELAHQVALRSGRTSRRPQSRAARADRADRAGGGGGRAWIGQWHISTRPAVVADRAVPGHWEGDLLIGSRGSSAIVTLVERATRFVMLGALPRSRASHEVVDVLVDLMGRVPTQLAQTLTWDQGSEMAAHAQFTLATGCQVYFCDPHSPWQRGSNENTNGLLRQYFPRTSTDFRTHTQADLDHVARELNTRPRQTLGWQTPAEKIHTLLVATAT